MDAAIWAPCWEVTAYVSDTTSQAWERDVIRRHLKWTMKVEGLEIEIWNNEASLQLTDEAARGTW